MSKRSKAKRSREAARTPARKKLPAGVVSLVVALAALGALGLWLNRSRPATPLDGTKAGETNVPNAIPPVPEAELGFQKLVGRWLRPDGGYVIEIRGVDGTGHLDAAYFNPRSIHVERAEVSREASVLKVLIVLRDVNYPGSTYTLAYNPATDQLAGVYFQAVERQSFDVFFERLR